MFLGLQLCLHECHGSCVWTDLLQDPCSCFSSKALAANKNALIAYLERAHSGVKGIVKDKYGETCTYFIDHHTFDVYLYVFIGISMWPWNSSKFRIGHLDLGFTIPKYYWYLLGCKSIVSK